MKFNISYPANGTNTLIEIDDEKKVRNVYEKQMGAVFEGELLGEEYAGYEFKITGGNDKQGFPMMQGILVPGRVRYVTISHHPSTPSISRRVCGHVVRHCCCMT
eukprot:TRINITY_DN1880_c0_g1_i2.p1 TRINITY_DN1880_c0_g1~~TRINITY_DN1880_c0_g1_i2.p1  ORF type:complete len:121 (+),score=18.23 TRINITY_DN1880_c0_g1_i2:52-363(+)